MWSSGASSGLSSRPLSQITTFARCCSGAATKFKLSQSGRQACARPLPAVGRSAKMSAREWRPPRATRSTPKVHPSTHPPVHPPPSGSKICPEQQAQLSPTLSLARMSKSLVELSLRPPDGWATGWRSSKRSLLVQVGPQLGDTNSQLPPLPPFGSNWRPPRTQSSPLGGRATASRSERERLNRGIKVHPNLELKPLKREEPF